MAIYDFFLSRNNGPTIANYVGHAGRLFYDSATGEIRISDGTTAGGLPIPITIASSTVTGGIKLGPGVVLNSEGQLIIDNTGLDFSFGDFQATAGTYTDSTAYAVLSSINTDQDIVIASNGTGSIEIVGELHVHATNGTLTGTLESEAVFRVNSDGNVRILVPDANSTTGAVAIVGGSGGVFQAPVNTGVMLHITGIAGSPAVPSRIYNDSQNSFGSFVTRRYNGTAAAPTAVLANEEILRLSGTAHNGTTIPGTANQRIVYKALGNQTTSNQGGTIEFWTTPLNSITVAKVATVDSTGITLAGDLFPDTDNTRVLGSADKRWADVWIGPGTINITDQTLLTNATLTVDNGVLQINGANQLQVGQLKFFENTIESITGNIDIQIGLIGSTANLVLNRNVVLGTGKTLNATTVTNGVYTTDTGTVTSTMLAGSIANAKLANSSVTVNGTSIALGASGTVTAAAGTLTGTTLAATVVTSSLTSVGTLDSLTVTNLVTAKNYAGQVRNLGTITAGAGTEITIDFATDHMVRFSYSTEPVQVAFTNYSAGKTVTLIAVNTNAANRQLEIGIATANTQGVSTLNVDGNETAIVTYYCTGTTIDDVFASTVYTV